ncbi:MAG: hypothetical protein IJS32_07340 [Kiritimatiellae bacterium]|nr:hypothetical protein [Kiritimatiellia bacterium]
MKRFLPLALLWLAAGAVFSPLLRAPFLFDDHTVIESDGAMVAAAVGNDPRNVPLLADLLLKPRPLRALTHRIEWRIAGDNAALPHAVNLLLHLAVAGAGFLLLRRRCGVDAATATIAAALFLFNPVAVESVGVVSHRKEMLSAFFLLLSLHAALESPTRFSWRAAAFLLLAAAGKETALAVFPALFLGLAFRAPDAADGKGARGMAAANRAWIRSFALYCAVAALGAAFFFRQIRAGMDFAGGNPGEAEVRAGHFTAGVAWSEAIGAAVRSFPRHLLLLALPVGHAPDPAIALHVPLFSLDTMAAALAVLLCAALLAHMARAGDGALRPALWMLAALAPYLCPWFLRSGATALLADRYLYLPSLGFAWLVAVLLLRLPRKAAIAAAVAVALLYAGSSFALCRSYRDEALYWERAVRENPASVLAAHNHAFALWKERGDFAAAKREFARMMRLAPEFDYGICSLAQMHAEENDPESALELLDGALARRPEGMHLHRQRALIGLLFGDDDRKTLSHFRAAARLGADDAAFHRGYAEILVRRLKWPEAAEEFALAARSPVFAEDARDAWLLLHDPVHPAWDGALVAGDSVPRGTGTGEGTAVSPLRSLAAALNERLAPGAAGVADASRAGSFAGELPEQLEAAAEKRGEAPPPTLCILWSGHNDAFAGVPPFDILRALAGAALACRRAGGIPVLVGPVSVRDEPDRPRREQEKALAALDKRLAAFCRTAGLSFVSARRVLGPNDPSLPSGANYAADSGNHLSREGIEAVARALLPFFPLEARTSSLPRQGTP